MNKCKWCKERVQNTNCNHEKVCKCSEGLVPWSDNECNNCHQELHHLAKEELATS